MCQKEIVCGMAAATVLPAEAAESFVLGTFNVRVPNAVDGENNTWEKRLPRCRGVFEKAKIDICGLQEPQWVMIDGLVKDTDYAVTGHGSDDFQKKGEFVSILYRKSRFELLKSGVLGLSETPDVPGARSWESRWARLATWGLFLDKKTGKEFIFYNTHLDNKSEPARENGLKMIVEHAGKNAAGKPLILSGDFNALPDSRTYQCATSLLCDSRSCTRTPPAGPEYTFHKWGTRSVSRLDYIFVSPEVKVLSYRTEDMTFDGLYPSDHYPVVVELSL